jgi:hypothetical protein
MSITLPTRPDPTVPTRDRLRPVRYEPGPGASAPAPVPAEPPRHPPPRRAAREYVDAHHAATRILRLALEVLDGSRPPTQLRTHFAAAPLRYWRATTGQRTARTRARCGRLRLCLPCSGVAEVAVTCLVDGRHRALAARFERHDGRWCCTAVRLG